jgi:SNF2 family DNA or RNA helicase
VLQSTPTKGELIADTTGLSKTFLTLLYLSYSALYDPREDHRPTLILTPNCVVLNQWVDAIQLHFRDLIVVVTHGEKPLELRKAQNWVSEAAGREAPKNLRHWPSRLR